MAEVSVVLPAIVQRHNASIKTTKHHCSLRPVRWLLPQSQGRARKQQPSEPSQDSSTAARKITGRSPQRTMINVANAANVGVLLAPLKCLGCHAPTSNERVTATPRMNHRWYRLAGRGQRRNMQRPQACTETGAPGPGTQARRAGRPWLATRRGSRQRPQQAW